MIKDIINSNESKNIHDDDIQFLKEHFPSCFTKQSVDYSGNIIPSKFDIEKLRKIIDPKIDIIQEGYGLDFLGKTYARYISSLQSETVVVPDTEHNSKEENKSSKNVYISGDNIDALKHLLKSYEQSVKCIYIDPPYNTGSDNFVYKDNFDFSKDDLQKKLNLSSNEAERVLDLTNRGSSSHSAWLMFMYPRLLLARGLLKDDGVIFISIDDNEQANLKLLCDDVFGEENFVGQINWKGRGGRQDSKYFAVIHEYILCYAKKIDNFEAGEEIKSGDVYPKYDKEIKRYYKTQLLRKWGSNSKKEDRPNLYYPIKDPDGNDLYPIVIQTDNQRPSNLIKFDGRWRWAPATMEKAFVDKRIEFIKQKDGSYVPYEKIFAPKEDEENTKKYITWIDDIGNGANDIKSVFGISPFDYAKPVALINRFVNMAKASSSDIILDFFSGSATTAHAVMQLNAEDKKNGKAGDRKYIMVQLPETVRKGSEAEKSGYKTIDQIGMKRIELAAAKIKSENTNLFSEENPLDLGFKHYTLKAVPQNTLDKLESFSESTLISDSSILSEFGEPTVLATWMCHDGYGLTSPYTEIDLGGYTSFLCGKHLYFINAEFTEKNVLELCKRYEEKSDFTPDKIVVFGYSFTMSVLNTLKVNVKVFKDTEKNLDISVDIRY